MDESSLSDRLEWHLEQRGIPDARLVSEFIDGCLNREFAVDPENHKPALFAEHFSSFALDLERLASGDFGRVAENRLSGELFDCVRTAREVGQGKDDVNGTFGFSAAKVPPFLFRSGFVHRAAKGSPLRFGYGKPDTVPATFNEAMCNLPPLLYWPVPYSENFKRVVDGLPPEWPPLDELERIDLAQTFKLLHSYYHDIVRSLNDATRPWFVNMPNAMDFYHRAQQLYRIDSEELHEVYVFSTTSGLVVREQYLGSDEVQTSQFRRLYFEALRTSPCRIYYQFDPATTWGSPKGIRGSTRPLSEHIEHFASFLVMPNLAISEIDFSRPEHRWRRDYTIVNTRNEVAFSSRSKDVRQIAEGLIAAPGFWKSEDLQPGATIKRLYQEQLPHAHQIKRMGERVTVKEARERAADAFCRWELEFAQKAKSGENVRVELSTRIPSMRSPSSPEAASVPTASDVERMIVASHDELVGPLNAWLASLDGMRFESKEDARVEMRRIASTVRSAGCELLWNGEPVNLVVSANSRQRVPSIQVRSRERGRRGPLIYSSVNMPLLAARPISFASNS